MSRFPLLRRDPAPDPRWNGMTREQVAAMLAEIAFPDLVDVDDGAPVDGAVPQWDADLGRYVPRPLPDGGGGWSNLRVPVAIADETSSIDLDGPAPGDVPAVLIWGRASGNGVYSASEVDGWTLLDEQPTLVAAEAVFVWPDLGSPLLDSGVLALFDLSDAWRPIGAVPTLDGNPSQVWGPRGWIDATTEVVGFAVRDNGDQLDLDAAPPPFPPFPICLYGRTDPSDEGVYDVTGGSWVKLDPQPDSFMAMQVVDDAGDNIAPGFSAVFLPDPFDGGWGVLAYMPQSTAASVSALADLTDVDVTSDPPAQDDVLAWDDTENKWTPATLDGGVALSDAAPQDLGTAAAGVSDEASRADHVHDMPTAADIAVDASGFNGNLTTSDDTVQEIAQKVDDLVTGGTVDVVSNVATSTILGRTTAGSGNSEELTPHAARLLIGAPISYPPMADDVWIGPPVGPTASGNTAVAGGAGMTGALSYVNPCPIWVPEDCYVDAISVYQGTAATDSGCVGELGWSAPQPYPWEGSLEYSAGTFDATATAGARVVTFTPQFLKAGLRWAYLKLIASTSAGTIPAFTTVTVAQTYPLLSTAPSAQYGGGGYKPVRTAVSGTAGIPTTLSGGTVSMFNQAYYWIGLRVYVA